MAISGINNLSSGISQITADIEQSVLNLRQKREGFSFETKSQTPIEMPKSGGFTPNYTINYLAAPNIYFIQNLVSEQNQIGEGGKHHVFSGLKDEPQTEKENIQNPDDASFVEELNQSKPKKNYQEVSKTYLKAENPMQNSYNSSKILLNNLNLSVNKRNYATSAYNFVYEINNQPKVLIDYMHEYNHRFDFRI